MQYETKQIPLQLTWEGPRPRGFYNRFQQWQISPYSSQQQWVPQQIVRFQYRISQGVMDPYRSHLDFTVQTDTNLCPVGGLQVDGSAHSFIQQLVIQNRATQIQRITQYSVGANIMIDMGQDCSVTQYKDYQGLGYVNLGTNIAYLNSSIGAGSLLYDNRSPGLGGMHQVVNSGLKSFTRVGNFSGSSGISFVNTAGPYTTSSILATKFSGIGSQMVSLSNPMVVGGSSTGGLLPTVGLFQGQLNVIKQLIATTGRLSNIRAQYLSSINKLDYPDSNTSTLHQCPLVLGQTYDTSSVITLPLTGYNKNNPYKIGFNATQNKKLQRVSGADITIAIPNTPIMKGYAKPFCQAYMQGGYQPLISPTIPQCQMQYGTILANKVPVQRRNFQVPLMSSVLGVLIPADQFLLIPSQALYDTMLQLTLDPFAMFTTGYRDIHQFDTVGIKYPQDRRGWYISKFTWNIHLYQFNDSTIRQYVTTSLTRGIRISTNLFQLANQINISVGTSISNRWNIMVLSQSLSQVYCRFYTTQHQIYSHCRKHFSVSNNIGQFQIKYNTQYFPAQPISGNAGNPQLLDTSGSCMPFLQLIYWSKNYMLNSNRGIGRINKFNFSINSRIYDPTNKQPYYPSTLLQIVDTAGALSDVKNMMWDSTYFNFDTAMGMSHNHQNRYIGRALYIWSWQPYGHGKTYLYGLNVQSNSQLHVIFNTINQGAAYNKDQILYIFTLSNAANVYTNKGILVYGR